MAKAKRASKAGKSESVHAKARRISKASKARKPVKVTSADKSRTVTTMAALISVGAGKTAKTVVSANQLADALGIDGKRLRGWLRSTDVLGNDGRYSHYAIDCAAKDGQTLIRRASERFRADFDATMRSAVKLASA
ncbi:hypothetical protein LCGC14_1897820 [marine sediment metagenome]|uniref:Uncharacterized protein n=1 Tax=marine sediment metagenome TaxID=412755 RepID=A0A0F9FXR5_9ZZZZ